MRMDMQDPEKTMVFWSLKEAMEMVKIQPGVQLSPAGMVKDAVRIPVRETVDDRIASLIAIELPSNFWRTGHDR